MGGAVCLWRKACSLAHTHTPHHSTQYCTDHNSIKMHTPWNEAEETRILKEIVGRKTSLSSNNEDVTKIIPGLFVIESHLNTKIFMSLYFPQKLHAPTNK